MKRHGNLWEAIVAFENLELAFRLAARGRRFRPEVLAFRYDLEGELLRLQGELQSGRYRTGTYRVFKVHDPKERDIFALPLRDRVVHHAVMNVVAPILERTFVHDSYACRRGKGTHRAVERLTGFLRRAHRQWPAVYVLKGDIRKCFPSISHHALVAMLARKIKCRRTLNLLDEIVFSTGSHWDPDSRRLPIGNLTSQWLCNYYLTALDHLVAHRLRVRFYVRYMDDFVLLGPDRPTMHAWRGEIAAMLGRDLRLALNDKTAIFPARLGVDFLGYRVWKTHRLLRKAAKRRIVRSLRGLRLRLDAGLIGRERLAACVNSWLAQLGHADAYSLARRLFAGHVSAQAIAARFARARKARAVPSPPAPHAAESGRSGRRILTKGPTIC